MREKVEPMCLRCRYSTSGTMCWASMVMLVSFTLVEICCKDEMPLNNVLLKNCCGSS
jgi:hypothetical protein